MEALLLFLDVGALIAVFIWAIRNSGVDGAPTGPFRFKDRLSEGSPPPTPDAPRWRSPR